MSDTQDGPDGPIIIKKYANRRLYNTESSSYVTLKHLAQMVRKGKDFEVRDARSGKDITRAILVQIIFEEENKGQHLLPVEFLRRLIRFYGDSLQNDLPGYLEKSMKTFARNQEDIASDSVRDQEIRELKDQLEAMQEQIAQLAEKH